MRIDPHILTPVRKEMEKEGIINRRNAGGGIWFSLASSPSANVDARLAEQLPIYTALQADNFKKRVGQTLEIAISRAIVGQDQMIDALGHFLDLDQHDDATLYTKEEPPRILGTHKIGGARRLDFLVRHPTAGWAGIEAKNIREWMYPDRDEIFDLLDKCLHLDVVPVLIARRIHFSTFVVLNACGVVMHQTYNQLYPAADHALATQARHKKNLGFHDIRTGNAPDARLASFIGKHLPAALPEHREKFNTYRDLIAGFVGGEMEYQEFAGRVRRRRLGVNEDRDWEPPDDYEMP